MELIVNNIACFLEWGANIALAVIAILAYFLAKNELKLNTEGYLASQLNIAYLHTHMPYNFEFEITNHSTTAFYIENIVSPELLALKNMLFYCNMMKENKTIYEWVKKIDYLHFERVPKYTQHISQKDSKTGKSITKEEIVKDPFPTAIANSLSGAIVRPNESYKMFFSIDGLDESNATPEEIRLIVEDIFIEYRPHYLNPKKIKKQNLWLTSTWEEEYNNLRTAADK